MPLGCSGLLVGVGMGRVLRPCGTEAAYRRHVYHGQVPCDACRAAHRAYVGRARRERVLRDTLARAAAHSAPLHVLGDPRRDRVRRLEENLAIVDAALADAVPREVPALSRRRQELEDAIWKLAGTAQREGGGGLDELARRRASRAAAAQA